MLKWIQIALLVLVVSFIMGYCWEADAAITEKYQCEAQNPFLVYILNGDGTVKAIIGSYQYGYILCVDQYCADEDSKMVEDLIYTEAYEKEMIRKIQLP